jgi:hypothetical protein
VLWYYLPYYACKFKKVISKTTLIIPLGYTPTNTLGMKLGHTVQTIRPVMFLFQLSTVISAGDIGFHKHDNL